MGFFIPEELKKYDNWIVCKDKKPYNLYTGKIASALDPCNHASYEEVELAYTHSGAFDGIGFAFSQEQNLTCIDLDNCINENGEFSALATEVMEMFKGTYMESSRSETGLHIICKGTIHKTIKRKEIEIYSQSHYFVITGNAWNYEEPIDKQKELDQLYNKYNVTPKDTAPEPKISVLSGYNRTMEEVINIIKKSSQGAKWERLYNGDITEYDNDTSAGAQAFINITNFFTGGNDEITSQIVKQSFFKNTKHARAEYIERSIRKAKEKGGKWENKTSPTFKVDRSNITDYRPPTRYKRKRCTPK